MGAFKREQEEASEAELAELLELVASWEPLSCFSSGFSSGFSSCFSGSAPGLLLGRAFGRIRHPTSGIVLRSLGSERGVQSRAVAIGSMQLR